MKLLLCSQDTAQSDSRETSELLIFVTQSLQDDRNRPLRFSSSKPQRVDDSLAHLSVCAFYHINECSYPIRPRAGKSVSCHISDVMDQSSKSDVNSRRLFRRCSILAFQRRNQFFQILLARLVAFR